MCKIARITLACFLPGLLFACSGKVTDPMKMVEIAAKHDDPHAHLAELYREAVLPEFNETSKGLAWIYVEYLTQAALKNNRFGFLPHTIEFPILDNETVTTEGSAIETATGKPCREYYVRGHCYVKNSYGTKVRLNIAVRMYSSSDKKWHPYQVIIKDPSKPKMFDKIVEMDEGPWRGFELLAPPDSLYTQLDAMLNANKKLN